MKRVRHFIILFACMLPGLACTGKNQAGKAFGLIHDGKPASVFYPGANQVINTAIDIFCSDMKAVCGSAPDRPRRVRDGSIVVVSLAEKTTAAGFLEKHAINTSDIEGRWEAFKIIPVSDDTSHYLLVIGSNARGTAYGILELSRMAGVSPWTWWADVTPEPREEVMLPAGLHVTRQPSVQYRGIFINDEDWGLVPWSAHFENAYPPGKVGPKTYSKILELLLRLRANTLWPAMHPSTVAFFQVEGNLSAAEKYGIIIGTSHCEPMLRNNVGEWDQEKRGAYDFTTNRDTVLSYWQERIREVKSDHVILTLGMRGVHDGKMAGANTLEEQTALTSQVIRYQREMIAREMDPDPSRVPQIFVPYKEVLDIYNNGLSLPEDVTLTWCDDNYGYITRLSNKTERERSGGAGVYYHASYWGRPHDYLWLGSTSPSLVYSEMKKAWDYQARKMWILNAGDIKPAEYLVDFFLTLAWDINATRPDAIHVHLQEWLEGVFGSDSGRRILPLVEAYYHLANTRKPEHVGWSRVQQPGFPGGFSPVVDTGWDTFGETARARLLRYEEIEKSSNEIFSSLPANRKDAYFQLVHYPIRGAAEINRKLLHGQKARALAQHDAVAAREYATLSRQAHERLQELTRYYNEEMASGKWRGMMNDHPRDLLVFRPLSFDIPRGEAGNALAWFENDTLPLRPLALKECPALVAGSVDRFVITIYQHTAERAWHLRDAPGWLKIRTEPGFARDETLLCFALDNEKVETSSRVTCTLEVGGERYPLRVSVVKPEETPGEMPGENCIMESKGMVSFPASAHNGKGRAAKETIQGLGHSLEALSMTPAPSRRPTGEEYLEYDIYTFSSGPTRLTVGFIPTHPVNGGELRYAVRVDDEEPLTIPIHAEAFNSEQWKTNVLRNQARGVTSHVIRAPGRHKIRVYALDDDMIIDQLLLEFNPGKEIYEFPAHVAIPASTVSR